MNGPFFAIDESMESRVLAIDESRDRRIGGIKVSRDRRIHGIFFTIDGIFPSTIDGVFIFVIDKSNDRIRRSTNFAIDSLTNP